MRRPPALKEEENLLIGKLYTVPRNTSECTSKGSGVQGAVLSTHLPRSELLFVSRRKGRNQQTSRRYPGQCFAPVDKLPARTKSPTSPSVALRLARLGLISAARGTIQASLLRTKTYSLEICFYAPSQSRPVAYKRHNLAKRCSLLQYSDCLPSKMRRPQMDDDMAIGNILATK